MIKKCMKKCSIHQPSGEFKLKPQWSIISPHQNGSNLKLMDNNAREDGNASTLGLGNVNQYIDITAKIVLQKLL